MGEPVQGLLGRGQQVRAVIGGQPGVVGAQAADRRLGRGERRAQVMADRREQRRPLPVGLGHPGGLPGEPEAQPTICQTTIRRRRSAAGGRRDIGLSLLPLGAELIVGRGRGRFRGDGSHQVLLAVLR